MSGLTGLSAFAVNQALDLRSEWKARYRLQASACRGATEGREKRSSSREATHPALISCAAPSSAVSEAPSKGPVLLLFLGDSLVSGVGGESPGDAAAPAALPQRVAAHLADRVGEEVQWASAGITGADVERLAEEGLPRLKEKMLLASSRSTDAPIERVIVVLVVGVNDLRQLKLGYRLRLRGLVSELLCIGDAVSGPEGGPLSVEAVLLPGLRIADAPMLQRWPLQCFLAPFCVLWEREKRKAIKLFQDAKVLPFS